MRAISRSVISIVLLSMALLPILARRADDGSRTAGYDARVRRFHPLLLLVAALTGCPESGKTGGDGAVVDSSTTATPGSSTPTPKDPLAGSVFKREEVEEIFRAEHAAGARPGPETEAERQRVLRKHRLVD